MWTNGSGVVLHSAKHFRLGEFRAVAVSSGEPRKSEPSVGHGSHLLGITCTGHSRMFYLSLSVRLAVSDN